MTAQTNSDTASPGTSPGLAWLKRVGNAAIDLFFPPHCVACNRYGAWLCPRCLDEIDTIQPPVCHRCGLTKGAPHRLQDTEPICQGCRKATPTLNGLCAYAFHRGPLREAIHQLKYQDLRGLAAPLGKLMSDGWTALPPHDIDIDVIVPVPLHASRQRERGYNQAALLSFELGTRLQLPVVQDALVRSRATAPQVELSAPERRTNVRDAFQCVNHSLSGKRVLLVDDVCTTGSTLEAAAKALRKGDVPFVWAYTLARASGKPGPDTDKTM